MIARPAALDARITVHRPSGFTLRLDLRIPPGTTTALLGPNGAGKSTAVWALTGILPIDSGSIRLGDRVLDDPDAGIYLPAEERRIGVVFQDLLLFPHLDVAHNVSFGPGGPRRDRRRRLQAAQRRLASLGLGDLSERRPGELSGGQAQQVALARALEGEPELMLLDEPLSALDVTIRTSVRRILRDHLEAFPGPRLLITHDPAEAFLMADRVVVLEEGMQTQAGTPDDIRRHPRTPYAADLAGVNLMVGAAENGRVKLDDGPLLTIGEGEIEGRVLVTVHPRAVALHPDRPRGSPRNAWATEVAGLEPLDAWVRVQLGAPLPMVAEITRQAAAELGLAPGRPVWAAVKAAELRVQPV